MLPLQTKWMNARNKADALLKECHVDLALTEYRLAYKYALLRDDREAIGHALLAIGSLHITRGDLVLAEDRLQQAHGYYQKSANKLALIQIQLNLAALDLKRERYQTSLERYQSIMGRLKQVVSAPKSLHISFLNGMAAALKKLGMTEEANFRYAEAERMALGIGNTRKQLAIVWLNQARMKYDNQKIEEAFSLVSNAITIDRKEENLLGIAADLSLLAMIAQERRDFQDARKLYHQAGRIYDFCGLKKNSNLFSTKADSLNH